MASGGTANRCLKSLRQTKWGKQQMQNEHGDDRSFQRPDEKKRVKLRAALIAIGAVLIIQARMIDSGPADLLWNFLQGLLRALIYGVIVGVVSLLIGLVRRKPRAIGYPVFAWLLFLAGLCEAGVKLASMFG